MKVLTIIFLSILSLQTEADVQDCLKDAKTNANHWHAVNPSIECADIIKKLPSKIEAKSLNGKFYIYGYQNMFFVEHMGKTELMAGDQTELTQIDKFEINETKERVIVIQKNSISTFKLSLIGNVTPERKFKSPILSKMKSAKLLNEEDMIAIFSQDSVRIINSNADTRYKVESLTPKLLHEISGDESSIKNPIDVSVDSSRKQIYVLDSGRILVFPFSKEKDDKPTKIFSASEAKSLIFDKNKLFFVKVSGEQVEVSLTK